MVEVVNPPLYLLVDDDPLYLVTEVPFGEGAGVVVERFSNRLTAELEVLRLNDQRKETSA